MIGWEAAIVREFPELLLYSDSKSGLFKIKEFQGFEDRLNPDKSGTSGSTMNPGRILSETIPETCTNGPN